MSHEERISQQQAAFAAAMKNLEDSVHGLDQATATRAPAGGGWSAAQIAWHVGHTNELLAAVLTGQAPMATPAPAGFQENPGVFSGIPDKLETFPQLVPPAGVSRADAMSKLKGSAQTYRQALDGMTQERAAGHCVDLPFGKLSLYQLADFAAAHVTRHVKQVHRATSGV